MYTSVDTVCLWSLLQRGFIDTSKSVSWRVFPDLSDQCLGSLLMTGLMREVWKVGWMHMVRGSWRRTAAGLKTLVMGNGPMYLGESLRESVRMGKSRVHSYTFWPQTEEAGAVVRWRFGVLLVSPGGLKEGWPYPMPGPVAAPEVVPTGQRSWIPGRRRVVANNHKHIQKEIPVAELGRVLWAYSAHGSWEDQVVELENARQRREVLMAWFALSACPLVCGWKPELRLTEAPRAEQKDFKTVDVNWGPRSETMSCGMPWGRNTSHTRISAVSRADGSLGRWMKWANFENRSITVWQCYRWKLASLWWSPRRCGTRDVWGWVGAEADQSWAGLTSCSVRRQYRWRQTPGYLLPWLAPKPSA